MVEFRQKTGSEQHFANMGNVSQTQGNKSDVTSKPTQLARPQPQPATQRSSTVPSGQKREKRMDLTKHVPTVITARLMPHHNRVQPSRLPVVRCCLTYRNLPWLDYLSMLNASR